MRGRGRRGGREEVRRGGVSERDRERKRGGRGRRSE